MTIRTQQDGYRWDPPAWCATEGCDRRAKVGSQWCFKCADKGTAISYGGGGDAARIRDRIKAVELFGEETGARRLYDMAPGAGAPSGGAGEQAAEAVREREAEPFKSAHTRVAVVEELHRDGWISSDEVAEVLDGSFEPERAGTPTDTRPHCANPQCYGFATSPLGYCDVHQHFHEAKRNEVQVRRHLRLRWERVHAGMADLILALRREGLDEVADEVTAGMDQIGKAVTRAGRGSGR